MRQNKEIRNQTLKTLNWVSNCRVCWDILYVVDTLLLGWKITLHNTATFKKARKHKERQDDQVGKMNPEDIPMSD